MHDPLTQLWSNRFFILWHVDPETDGSDDSCGWFSPRLTKEQLDRLESIARDEAQFPWFAAFEGKQIESPTEAETLLAGAFWLVARVLRVKVSHAETRAWAQEGLHNSIDHFRSSLAFLAGWHCNSTSASGVAEGRAYRAQQFFIAIARWILRVRRPWYRKPRWHVHHWSLQIHVVQRFKRWAWSRCERCGKGFAWGRSVISGVWDCEGPQWFRSEQHVYHPDCSRPKAGVEAAMAQYTDFEGVTKNEQAKLS